MIHVIRYLSSIPDKKVTGKDGISVAMLKKTLPFTLNVLTDMLNRLLCDGVFPSCWKIARVTPIFKGGSVENPLTFDRFPYCLCYLNYLKSI